MSSGNCPGAKIITVNQPFDGSSCKLLPKTSSGYWHMTQSIGTTGTRRPGSRDILGSRIDATSYDDATDRIMRWAAAGESCYVCAANVHMVMEAYDDPGFSRVVSSAVLVTADGMPLVWGLRQLGIRSATRVYGPTLTLHVCHAAAEKQLPVALYGGTEESLAVFTAFLGRRFPQIRVVCGIAPPFRALTAEEDRHFTDILAASGARILLVGIGCPKQERWMAEHESRIPAVMLGVGAAFDFHSGRVSQAPPLLQRMGLEWLYRLIREPRRLWKRYFKHNPRFIYYFSIQLVKFKLRHFLSL
jgi:N-acetylglucosaminyldiphosphoundecaprenol N-acetyl-beta-D-mannosaminyltransferase